MKDYITLRSQGKKHTIQKRYLNMKVFEAYRCFKEERPDSSIGKSKFAELRPAHVLKRSETPRNVCLCRYHENINLQIQALQLKGYEFPRIVEISLTTVCATLQTLNACLENVLHVEICKLQRVK